MIDLYYWTTPNGHKITIFLEETQLPYRLWPVDIGAGEQFKPEFLAIAPNNRIPAIADMAIYPWIVPHERQRQDLADFPDVKRWYEAMQARPAVARAYELARTVNQAPTVSDKSRKLLFGQTAKCAAGEPR